MKQNLVPYPKTAYREQTVQFGGVNYGQDASVGELAESLNLSAREFPSLSQRAGRNMVEGYEDAEAVFDYFGKLIVCAGGILYMDGKAITQVLPGEKQFAVVNTQLVVWPDKIVVSLTEEKVIKSAAVLISADAASTVLAADSVAAARHLLMKEHGMTASGKTNETDYYFYTYGTDPEKVMQCWDGETKTWRGLEALRTKKSLMGYGNEPVLLENDILIAAPDRQNIPYGTETYPDPENLNKDGRYCVITKRTPSVSVSVYTYVLDWDVYKLMPENLPYADFFEAGDRVTVSGGEYGLAGQEHIAVQQIDKMENKLVFAADTLRVPILVSDAVLPQTVIKGETVRVKYVYENSSGKEAARYYSFSAGAKLPAGCVLYFLSADVTTNDDGIYTALTNVRAWDPNQKMEYGPWTLTGITETAVGSAPILIRTYPEIQQIKVCLDIPQMDYICSGNNRLWGVNNRERQICGSALGLPFEFYDYSGISTDSYAVAVGSDGDFTGCCGYDAGVLFWKEDTLHKLVGTAPDNFCLYEYTMRGVMKGSHRSLTVIDETLFFHSREGVCAYTGGVPQLISGNFGLRRFRNAVGGTDGQRYYLAMEDAQSGEGGVWVFDPGTGIWLREDGEKAAGFACLDGVLYRLGTDGVLTEQKGDFEEDGEWSATFCEMTETVHDRKYYSGLLLRYVLGENAEIHAEICTDDGLWRQIMFRKNTGKAATAVLPIRPHRCDKFQLRLSGTGYCRIESLVRKFKTGGTW